MPKKGVHRAKEKTLVTIGEAFKNFYAEKKAKGVVQDTLDNYEQSLRFFKEFASFTDDTDIKSINKPLIIGWINSMKEGKVDTESGELITLTPAAINHYIRDVRVFLYWCMNDEHKYIEHFKVEQVAAQEPKTKTYTKDDLKRLLAKPKTDDDTDFVEWRNWAIANLAYDMGARCATIQDIRIGDINFQKRTIYLRHTKNKTLTHATISSACAKVLKQFIETWREGVDNEDYLFCSYGGGELKYSALAHSFTKYCKSRGVEMHSLHGIRHSFATALASNTNGDMVKVQKALGHSSIDMARKYINLAEVDMGDYDNISPLAKAKDTRGKPRKGVKRKES